MNNRENEIKLELKLVGDVRGKFMVKSYQRGYRWGKEEVIRLLDDIYLNGINGTGNYCLQPIVVKKENDGYELIDGQQRLTTLFLIYKYMNRASNSFIEEPKFSLQYETREESERFLSHVDLALKEKNIDFYFMGNAYETIEEWFNKKEKKSTSITNFNKYLDESVKIIWYEVDRNEDSNALFNRLNMGKIPLTSAELVKALFLCQSSSNMAVEKKEEIALQWDNMEKELNNNSLWYFLTNSDTKYYPTRIDLIIDLIANKSQKEKDKYFTFFYFDSLKQKESLEEIWRDNIQHTFLILKDWYENHELYHKIGYLITSQYKTLQDIFNIAKGKTKTEFKQELDKFICGSIKIDRNYAELNYKENYDKLRRLLLLFNIESVRQNGEQTQWFPFDKYKFKKNNQVAWSIEHIHAQNSEGLKDEKDWKEWIELHIPSIKALGDQNDLVQKMKIAYERKRLGSSEFEEIQKEVIERLSVKGNTEYEHTIGNLALLNREDNAALSNSAFDVKRNKIIDMDQKGQYIPFCTKMVFLKYYTQSEKDQIHFWGQADRIAYIKNINRVLHHFLTEEILVEEEEK